MSNFDLSMHHVTVADAPLPDFIRSSAKAGCASVTLFVNSLGFDFPTVTAATADEVRHVMQGEGVGLTAVADFVLLDQEPSHGFAAGVDVHKPDLELGARLGARFASVVLGDVEEGRAVDILARFSEAASEFGLEVAVEFLKMTPGCATIGQCDRIVRQAASPNASILLDVTHFMRSGGVVEDLRAMDTSLVKCVHLADGRAEINAEEIEHEMLYDRLPAGEGEFPLVEILASLPRGVVYEIEAPGRALAAAGLSVDARMARNVAAAQGIVSQLQGAA